MWYILGIVASAAILFLAGVAVGFGLPADQSERVVTLEAVNGRLRRSIADKRARILTHADEIARLRDTTRSLRGIAEHVSARIGDMLAVLDEQEAPSGNTEDRS